MPSNFIKDPDAVLDYAVDWSAWLASGETITASTWTVDTGLTKNSDTHSTTATVAWLSGGTVGVSYLCVNHITTSAGRQDDRTLTIVAHQR